MNKRTHVRVTNLENNRSVILRVNDRGPFWAGGTERVMVETMEPEG